ncbi:MutS domain V [Lachnospiraceae bacterium RM5]|nr:MutS domain V [Lachnospiraceae bacterium RM5]
MLKYIAGIFIIAFLIFLVNTIRYKKSEEKKKNKRIAKAWGKRPKKNYSEKDLLRIKSFFEYSKENSDFVIDDITWNDLDLDGIYRLINNTNSSIGEEYLYKILRIPEFDEDVLKDRDKIIDAFYENKDDSFELQKIFKQMGRTKSVPYAKAVKILNELKGKSNIVHYILNVLFIASLVMIFIRPIVGLVSLIVMLIVNISTYFSEKGNSLEELISIKYLVDMMKCSKKILKKDIGFIADYNLILKNALTNLKGVDFMLFLISSGNEGSVGEVILEYLRMLFHVDIIRFNQVAKKISGNYDDIRKIYDALGNIEADIAIASFREMNKDEFCKPEFSDNARIECMEVFHPLIEKPVKNDFKENKCVLITGSNASGKSTFLRTIAINAIFAQTIYTCTAKSFKTCMYKTVSSMSLSDNLNSNDSYYMVEIKAIKRILDMSAGKIKTLTFVDEVLRGTNTIERIAASSYVLENLSKKNCMCFAATHDIELTEILKNSFSNYHFNEQVKDDDVFFSYKINDGKATTKNAIKLLSIIGFDKEIVDNASDMAKRFENDGIWDLT